MSRAFTKEPDGDRPEDELPERISSIEPHPVTASGLKSLKARLAALKAERTRVERHAESDPLGSAARLKTLDREIRHLTDRIEHARLVDLAAQPKDEVAFGAVVTVERADGETQEFTIVGEDEADAAVGRISHLSPLAHALLGARVEDSVLWRRPAGDLDLTILAIRYPTEG